MIGLSTFNALPVDIHMFLGGIRLNTIVPLFEEINIKFVLVNLSFVMQTRERKVTRGMTTCNTTIDKTCRVEWQTQACQCLKLKIKKGFLSDDRQLYVLYVFVGKSKQTDCWYCSHSKINITCWIATRRSASELVSAVHAAYINSVSQVLHVPMLRTQASIDVT